MILGLSRSVRVFVYLVPADPRKGHKGLFGLVQNGLRRDLLSGELYLFVNLSTKLGKMLVCDGARLVAACRSWAIR